jgi:hypothetical protein
VSSAGKGTSYSSGPVDPALEVDPAVGEQADPTEPVDQISIDVTAETPRIPPARRARGTNALLLAALTAVLAFPLIVALFVLRRPHWYPLLDMAQTELRVRDVGTSHPPLIGLAGRIGPFGPNGGSHPGPLSFYALYPVWRLFGGSSYGLFASDVALDIVAIGLSLWMALRRGGRGLLLGVAAVLAVLTRAYGAFLLTLPWNPYLPVLWWFVFVLAVWSVVVDDLAMIPVAVFAGSFCMQTHISYLGLVGGMVLIAAVAVAWNAVRRRREPKARRALWLWGGLGVVLGIVLWTPPVIDQFVHTPGNLGIIRDYFSHPPASPIGFRTGVNVLLAQLDPWKLMTHTLVHDPSALLGPSQSLYLEVAGSRLPGTLLLLAFGASAIVAWRLRHRLLISLDVVVIVALALGLVSTARIFGTVWFYLLLWSWGLAALMLLAIGWTVVELVRRRNSPATNAKLAPIGAGALVLVTLVVAIAFSFQASEITVQTPRLNESLGAIVGPTADALTRLQSNGAHGPYLVSWLPDAEAIGSAGFGLLNELDRRGFDVRADGAFTPGATRYHVIGKAKPTLEVHLATGPDIANWRNNPQFTEVASFDPRTADQLKLFNALHGQVVDNLNQEGLHTLVPQVDNNLFMLALAPNVPANTKTMISQMLDLSMPVAVFIGPPQNG